MNADRRESSRASGRRTNKGFEESITCQGRASLEMGPHRTFSPSRSVFYASEKYLAPAQTYEVKNAKDGPEREESLAWLLEFIELMGDEVDRHGDLFTVAYLTGRSVEDALRESVTGEIVLVMMTCRSLSDCKRQLCAFGISEALPIESGMTPHDHHIWAMVRVLQIERFENFYFSKN